MEQFITHKILTALKKARTRGVSRRELLAGCNLKPKKRKEFDRALAVLVDRGEAAEAGGRVYLASALPTREAAVTRLNRTFGFARYTDDGTEVFIPGKFFLGALPGDTVLVTPIASRSGSPEGRILRIVKEGGARFSATLLEEEGGWLLRPDGVFRRDVWVSARDIGSAKPGDKVLCEVTQRGASHDDHRVRIVRAYGDGQTAAHCAEALLDLNGISLTFPDAVGREAEAAARLAITESDLKHRRDLREEPIFTIDSADSKDLDDAVMVRKTPGGWELSVHIADVSHYVRPGTALDDEAFARGTSIYFADRVVPMLPPALSNGICSLNPQEDRLAFSCILTLAPDGARTGYRFEKSVIRSRVKGVYAEVNAILAGEADDALLQKYDGLLDSIRWMNELAGLLAKRKRERGAPDIDTAESRILLDADSRAVGVAPRTRGVAEGIIEEFMLLANEAAAHHARERGLPFVYRVHEPPTAEKLERLREILRALGIDSSRVETGMPVGVLSDLLRAAHGKPCWPIVNMNVLRAMSKAKYLEQPIGHYGLALGDYAHFTSPIRRYPDLSIHRILSAELRGMSPAQLHERFDAFAIHSARQSSGRELTAMQLERDCEDCYKAEYMKSQLGETFDGVITSLAPQGMYVTLESSIEGLVKPETLPGGPYEFDGLFEFFCPLTGQRFRIGEPVRVVCTGADVAAGHIDFELAGEPAE